MRAVSTFHPSGNMGPRLFSVSVQPFIFSATDFSALIREIHFGEKTVAIFDIDNTLMYGIGSGHKGSFHAGYGSDFWFVEGIKKAGSDTLQISKHIEEYVRAQHHIRFRLTENYVPEQLKMLQEAGIPIIGLTARSSPLKEITSKRLSEFGIQFTPLHNQSIELTIPNNNGTAPIVYHNGIIFCSGVAKDTCFNAFIKLPFANNVFSTTRQVFFMDDSHRHCASMYRAITTAGFKPVVSHYTYVDKHIPKATEEEMEADKARIFETDFVAPSNSMKM